ncbi:hypothetical protein O999_06975 [Pseudomonas putida LF54]|nr:hypothetical protein O999_06975 [Pseudomonas putida LF54]POG00465.1 hypothetical protein BGP83_25475 [Pseudomonas putida]
MHFGQILMRVPAKRTVDQPLAVLHIDGKTIDQRLLFIALGNEVEAVLVFGVQHEKAPGHEKADRVACIDDERMTDEI